MSRFDKFWRALPRWARRAALSVLALLVFGAAVQFYCASSPRGVYLDPYFDPETFWVFKDGKVYLTVEKGLEYAGPYSKVQNRWVVDKGYVKPSFFGLRWYDPQFNNGGVHFLPRRCFKWFYYKLTRSDRLASGLERTRNGTSFLHLRTSGPGVPPPDY